MRKIISLLAVMTIGLSLSACGSQGTIGGFGPKAIGGALIGAGLGGYGGSEICDGDCGKMTTVAGVLLGGLVGGAIGDGLDSVDRMEAQQAEQQAVRSAPAGQQITWDNPNTGNSGYTQVNRRGTAANGGGCAEYTSTIYVNGQAQTATGTACQRSDGTWQTM